MALFQESAAWYAMTMLDRGRHCQRWRKIPQNPDCDCNRLATTVALADLASVLPSASGLVPVRSSSSFQYERFTSRRRS
jgi:hypothetical protein